MHVDRNSGEMISTTSSCPPQHSKHGPVIPVSTGEWEIPDYLLCTAMGTLSILHHSSRVAMLVLPTLPPIALQFTVAFLF